MAWPEPVSLHGTWYRNSAQRTGINTERKYPLLVHAFEDLGCNAVEFRTHYINGRSRRAIERLGAKFDGIRRSHMIIRIRILVVIPVRITLIGRGGLNCIIALAQIKFPTRKINIVVFIELIRINRCEDLPDIFYDGGGYCQLPKLM